MTDFTNIQYNLLGNYLNNQDIFDGCKHLLRPHIFTSGPLRDCYTIITAAYKQGHTINSTILEIELTKKGLTANKAALEVAMLEQYPLTDKLVNQYVEILFKEFLTNYLKEELTGSVLNLSEGDPYEVMTKVKDTITSVELAINNVSRDRSILDVFDEAMTRITDVKNSDESMVGFSFGVPTLDEKTGGIPEGITVLAGSKGGGKTSLAINIIRANAVESGVPVLFFSMEMKARDLMINLMANYKEINSKHLRTGNVDTDQINSLFDLKNKLKNTFEIDETGGITWQYFEAKCKGFRKKHKLPYSQPVIVILDYLQLMGNSADEKRSSKEERVEQICTELMRVSKNENLSLVLLSQLSRESEKRGASSEKSRYNPNATIKDQLSALRPRMSDLKGSSAIEANAVLITLLFRPEYHNIKEDDNGNTLEGLCEINIPKNRFDKPMALYVRFEGKYNKFTDYKTSPAANGGIVKRDGPDDF